MTHSGAIWAMAHRLARLVWKLLHDNLRYVEKGDNASPQVQKRRAQRLTQAFRKLGYTVTLTPRASQPA